MVVSPFLLQTDSHSSPMAFSVTNLIFLSPLLCLVPYSQWIPSLERKKEGIIGFPKPSSFGFRLNVFLYNLSVEIQNALVKIKNCLSILRKWKFAKLLQHTYLLVTCAQSWQYVEIRASLQRDSCFANHCWCVCLCTLQEVLGNRCSTVIKFRKLWDNC